MHRLLIVTLIVTLFVAAPLQAQPIAGDGLLGPFDGAGAQKAAAVASWVTLGVGVGLDVVGSVREGCEAGHCRASLMKAGLRQGTVAVSTLALKKLVHRRRPCAPDCGSDNPDFSFPSGHTAYAFSAIGGPRLEIVVPLAVTTAGLRVKAGRHWLTDTVGGAVIGLLASRIR